MTEGVFPKVSGSALYASEINKVLSVDRIQSNQTGGTSTSTSETKMAEVTISANTVSNGVLVIASGKSLCTTNQGGGSITLRTGTSATITDNTLQKTITRVQNFVDANDETDIDWTIIFYVTGLTWTSTNYMQIGGYLTAGDTGTITCESLIAFPL